MSTNMASKFVRKNFGTVARVSSSFKTKHCLSVLYTKVKSTRFAGASIDLFARHANYSHGAKQRSLLPHVFAVFGVVCGGNTNENENSAKSGISQDATPPVRIVGRPTSSRCTNGRFGKMKQQKEHWPHERGVKNLGDSKRLRLRVLKGN